MTARSLIRILSTAAAAAAIGVTAPMLAGAAASPAAAVPAVVVPVTSKPFTGAKANTGTVTLDQKDGRYTLTLSDDFKTPDTPAPHWQVVDSAGNIYLLRRMKTKEKEEKGNRSIVVPEYIHDLAKVQVWCAWAEALLGGTTFNGVQTLVSHSSMASPAGPHVSTKFAGAKANTGTVTHAIKDGRSVLTFSDDFVTPDTPAPHWRIVDSTGTTYLLQSLKTKGDKDKANRSIVVPAYIPDIAKVQIWCAWAEANLGESSFEPAVR